MSHRPDYPSDLTDEEWQIIESLVPPVESGGRPAEHGRREIVNAIFYVLRTGCQWRFLPHDFPSWGRRSSPIFATGDWTEPGKVFTTVCAARCEKPLAVNRNQAQLSWIVKRSRPAKKGAAWLRCGEEDKWPKTPYYGRYLGLGAGSKSPRRLGSRPRWRQDGLAAACGKALASEEDLG